MADIPFPERVAGAALGQACGDAFGFQVERSGPDAAKAFSDGWIYDGAEPQPRRDGYDLGQVSDDTQCSRIFVETALLHGRHDPMRHAEALVRGAGDLVGAGSNTLRMLRALAMTEAFARGDLQGALRERADGMDSGRHQPTNGVVMRAWVHAVLHGDRDALAQSVLADAVLTHSHPEAGSCAVTAALAARLLFEGVAFGELVPALRREMPAGGETVSLDLAERLVDLGDGAADGVWEEAGRPVKWRSVAPLARTTLAWSLYSLHVGTSRGPDVGSVLARATECGGDVDTTAALALGWFGASEGAESMPSWLASRVNDRRRWDASVFRVRGPAGSSRKRVQVKR